MAQGARRKAMGQNFSGSQSLSLAVAV